MSGPTRADQFIRDRWLSVDPRTLGLFRIAVGVLLLTNLWDRVGGHDLVAFYSNEGLFPNHWALFRPPAHGYWSLLLGFSSPAEMLLPVAVIAAIYVAYTVGWQTRVMQVLALLAYESLNLRFLLIQHGGNVVVNILLVWSLFLPLGERLSIDALRKSLRSKVERSAESLNARGWVRAVTPHVGFAFFCLCLNFAGIYFFNALHKQGPGWHEGSVIHWILWQSRMATPLAVWLRAHEPFWMSPVLTWSTLVVEWALPFLILSPFFQRWLRPLAFLNIVGLHGGIALLCVLGPFSWSMMCFSVLLLGPADWDLAQRWLENRAPSATVRVDFSNPVMRACARVAARLDAFGHLKFEDGAKGSGLQVGALQGAAAIAAVARCLPLGVAWARLLMLPGAVAVLRLKGQFLAWLEVEEQRSSAPEPSGWAQAKWVGKHAALVAILTAVLSQFWVESWGIPKEWKPATRPQWMVDIVDYLQIPEGWSMFAPDAPREDSRLVVDATLADGSHLDLLTGEAPDFEIMLRAPWGLNQHWCEIHSRMRGWPQHWKNFRDYLLRRPALLGWSEEKRRVVGLEVWQVTSDSPPPGGTVPSNFRKQRLFGLEAL